jgi:urease accessory protein
MTLPARPHGRLSLELICDNGRTVIAHQRSDPPLQIFGLQYAAESDTAYLQVVNPSGGLFAGDTADIEVTLQPGAHVYLTTQAATKVYPAAHSDVTRQRIRLRVAQAAILEYFPLPLIPFAHARYVQEVAIQVDLRGVCLMADVLAPGRMARGEQFAYDMVRSRVEGWVGDRLALFEQIILEPCHRSYEGSGLLEGRAYLATLYALTAQPLEPWVPQWNRQLMPHYGERVGISALAYGGLVARLLAHTSQEVLRRLDEVHRLIREQGLGLLPLHVYRPFG